MTPWLHRRTTGARPGFCRVGPAGPGHDRGVTGWYRGTTWVTSGGPGNSPARHRKSTVPDRDQTGASGF